MILKNRSILELKNIGLIMEGIIQRHALSSFGQINFFRDPKGREVDLVVTYKTQILPIESQYTDRIVPHDFKNLLYFMRKMNIEEGLIITKNLLDVRDEESKKIYLLPLWAFLLTVV